MEQYADYIKRRLDAEERITQCFPVERMDCPERNFWGHEGLNRRERSGELLLLIIVSILAVIGFLIFLFWQS